MDGLKDDFEVVAANPCVAHQIRSRGLAGKQEHTASGDHRANLNRGLDAAHSRHDNVGKKNIGAEMARGLHRFLAAINRCGFKAILIENHSQGVGDEAFIVGDEHSGPDSAVGGKRVHKTLAENEKNVGVVQRVYPRRLRSRIFFLGS